MALDDAVTDTAATTTTAAPRVTAWARTVPTPLRDFLATETGSAVVLLAATIAALVWVNLDSSSYTRLWSTESPSRWAATASR